ncbi:MAG: ribosomal RNA small subunit methyltransferase A [Synergistaceae bacterium]|nr:ribosomal RNA small subunit methyltransferase A [Synergistaceae bacterium]
MPDGPCFHQKKSLGQNFLTDRKVLSQIIDRASLSAEDVVLEIGPGQGVLTRELLASPCAFIHSVEIDRGLEPFLADLLLRHQDRFALHWADALLFDYSSLNPVPLKVVANLPYNVTTPLLWRLLEFLPRASEYIVMVQKEAAERLTAPPRTKARYPLGITLEIMGHAEIILSVPPSAFRPSPKVDSAVLKITLSGTHPDLPRNTVWRELLRRGFAQRRKKLSKNLRAWRPDLSWSESLQKAGIEENARAEELTISQWMGLLRSLESTP